MSLLRATACVLATLMGYSASAEPVDDVSGKPTPPNVLIWLMDDVGYGQVGAFGGLIDTPTLDGLARAGLRFNNFHSTAICSPSRAALLTGRNHHAVAMGNHAGLATADAGYTSRIPRSAASIAKILGANGYATWAIGKWDQFPQADATPAGPYDYWPSGQGFERFYGFLYADMDHFHPLLWSDHTPVEPPRMNGDYHLTTDLADKAIEFVEQHRAAAPQNPFFLYWATGAVHAPHHAPQAYREKYRGRFDMGWDRAREMILERQKRLGVVPQNVQLPPRNPAVQTWGSLGKDEQRMASRAMEAFAAQLEHADHEFGRILAALRDQGILDNTIVLVMSDNGASAEGGLQGTFNEWKAIGTQPTPTWAENLKHFDDWGGPKTYPHYPVGWAMAGNTPFKYYKTTVHYGGVRGPMIVSWPARLHAHGEVRTQFHHLTDVLPTVLEAAGITAPDVVDGVPQQPIDGVSMLYAFDAASARTRHHQQYFELFGNRAIVADGWKAVVLHRKEPWNFFRRWSFDEDVWELYRVDEDFNETRDLARSQPQKLAELQALFDREAKRNHVYPLGPDAQAFDHERVAKLIDERGGHFEYRANRVRRISSDVAPPTTLGSFTIQANLEIPAEGARGVITAHGGAMGGYSLYVENNRPIFLYNYFGSEQYLIRAPAALSPGKVTVRLEFKRDTGSGAGATLLINDRKVADGRIDKVTPRLYEASDVFNVGLDEGSCVSSEYGTDNAFSGKIERVVFDVESPRSQK